MTTVELLVASAISVLVLGAVLAVVTPVQAVVRRAG
jgi:Tfp pilus assembly protein PilW